MTVQSFSGTDFSVVIVLDQAYLNNGNPLRPFKFSSEMQTITVSSTSSVYPVRALGKRKAVCYTKGARTFAGSLIFSVIDKDPFQELFAFDALNTAVRSDGLWHVDMLPPFDIVLTAINEGGNSGVQIISGVTLSNTGTTYSVDDIYTETTYTYLAEYVSPFIKNPMYDNFLKLVRGQLLITKTPDDLIFDKLLSFSNVYKKDTEDQEAVGLANDVGTNGVYAFPAVGSVTDPIVFQSLLESPILQQKSLNNYGG